MIFVIIYLKYNHLQNVYIWYFSEKKIHKTVYKCNLSNIQHDCWRSQSWFFSWISKEQERNSLLSWLVMVNKYAICHSWHYRHYPWLLFESYSQNTFDHSLSIHFLCFILMLRKNNDNFLRQINYLLNQITAYRNSLVIWLYNLYYGRFFFWTLYSFINMLR